MVRKRIEVQEDLQSRVRIYMIAVVIVFATIVARLWFMQVLSAEEYKELSDNNRLKEITVEAIRGDIYDNKGRVLTTSRPSICITGVPYILKKYPESKKRFIKLTKISHKEINEKLVEKKEDPLKPKIIIRDAEPSLVYYLKEHSHDFPGIRVEEVPVRDYPNGSVAPHVIGYVGEVSDVQLAKDVFKDVNIGDLVGKDGVEYQYNSTLMGIKGKKLIETDSKGTPTRTIKSTNPVAGSSIELTINMDVQKATEEALGKAVKAARSQYDKNFKKHYLGTAGAAVVLDVNNGDVISMASSPSYDPAKFIGGIEEKEWNLLNSKEAHAPMNNRAYVSLYPPASTFKPFTAISSLQEGLTTIHTPFTCTGEWRKWNQTFKCWKKKGHGTLTLGRAISESCDVYFYNTGAVLYQSKKNDGESLQLWSQRFGFGKKTRIPLPNEGGTKDTSDSTGRVPTKKWKAVFNRTNNRKYQIWYPGDTINMSIGQGDLLVSPLQLANAYGAIANGGTLYRPKIVKRIKSPKGKTIKKIKSKINKKVHIKGSVLAAIKDGLKNVVRGEGTASGAFAGFNIPVAGKTGTAQVKGKQDTALFVGYAPINNPRYVVVIIVEEGGNGSSVAAPAAREIFAELFNKEKQGYKLITGASD